MDWEGYWDFASRVQYLLLDVRWTYPPRNTTTGVVKALADRISNGGPQMK
jgi:hypothetical protein